MPFSKRALQELEEQLRNEEKKIGSGFTSEELEETASLFTGIIAAALKMRQRFSNVGRPIRKTRQDTGPRQGVLPGLEIDKQERSGTNRSSKS
jgi:hypothetical protein